MQVRSHGSPYDSTGDLGKAVQILTGWGPPRLEHEDRAAGEACRARWKALAATPAATLAGAMLKARIAVECHDGVEGFPLWVEQAQTTDEALALSAVLDLARLAPGT